MADVAYRKIGNVVWLQGQVSGGTASLVFTLPDGFRPHQDLQLPVATELGAGVATILVDGSILVPVGDGWISFDGISFLSD